MDDNPLIKLESFGQSIWMDTIRRNTILSGDLQRFIEKDGLSGVTSNPSIFEKAISGSHDYDTQIRSLALEGKNRDEIYLQLVVEDIQRAADLFKTVYTHAGRQDGFVSLEVSPRLAYDTSGTIEEARRLWATVNRPNVMIKVPGTQEGLPAIEQLIREGININITLLFGLPRYKEVIEAYLSGLEKRLDDGKPIDNLASVASFFLSRIDSLIDPQLEKGITAGKNASRASSIQGQVAISSAKLAYQSYKEIYQSERFNHLAARGAHPQRLLWASTSAKNPAYSDVVYVEKLIGPDTINTLTYETLNAYRDHGNPKPRLEEEVAQAKRVLGELPEFGINLDGVTQELEIEGIKKFLDAYDLLMETIKNRRESALAEPVDLQTLKLNSYTRSHHEVVLKLERDQAVERLWRKDATLWSSDEEVQKSIQASLGWLHVAEKMDENLNEIITFVQEVKNSGYKHVVHMGMGGSSLAPLVFKDAFQRASDGLDLAILDTTDPATILKIENDFPPEETLYIIASKSGTTAEPAAFGDYFYDLLKSRDGDQAGKHFVAITDPETKLINEAKERGFRKIFVNFSDIGGRFSALSYFGLVPAALYGIDIAEILIRALRMQHACEPSVPLVENPGLMLGAALGELGRLGRDKVTFLMPDSISSLGMWLEQLIAESTGKNGSGILPVAGERLGRPSVYGQDRLFIYFRLANEIDNNLELGVQALEDVGQPVITIQLADRMDIGQEFFRWEFATAIAGSILEINAFDQPNVQESKDNTNRLLKYFSEKKSLPAEKDVLIEKPLSLSGFDLDATIRKTLSKFLSRALPGDYIALLPYLGYDTAVDQSMDRLRLLFRDHLHLATTYGYGPRYLHSTGQYHKGGPNTGIFFLITARHGKDAKLEGRAYTFAIFNQAQALGDMEALQMHKRRVVHIDLGDDISEGLAILRDAIESALVK